MRAILLVILISFSVLAEEREYEQEIDLGDGFTKLKYRVENPQDHWEEYAHYSTTFYQGVELGMLDGLYTSPSKKYAFYVKSVEGRLYLMELASKTEKPVKFDKYCFPYDPKWGENMVTTNCYGEGETEFLLQIDLTNQSTTRLSAPDS